MKCFCTTFTFITVGLWLISPVYAAKPVVPDCFFSKNENNGGVTRALVVGISSYQDTSISAIPNAVRDAEAFAIWLKTRPGERLNNEQIELLTDSTATMAQFSVGLDWLLDESQPGDNVILFFSGYGVLDTDDKGKDPSLLLLYDSPLTPLPAGAFPFARLRDILQQELVSRKVNFFFSADLQELPFDPEYKPDEKIASNEHAFEYQYKSTVRRDMGIGPMDAQSGGARLLNALLGLADRNLDRQVTWKELKRYTKSMEDTSRHAGMLFLAVSDNDYLLALVDERSRDALFHNTSDLFPGIVHLETSGLEDSILETEEEFVRKYYQDFILSIKLGNLLTPPGRCAASLYDSLVQHTSLRPMHGHLRRRLAAALQDEAQQALNAYLNNDPKELVRRLRSGAEYDRYPQYLAKAAELLGVRHFLYRLIQAKQYYFEGFILRLHAEEGDTIRLWSALDKLNAALAKEPEAAFIFNEIGNVFSGLKKNEEALKNYQKAIELAPAWGIPYINICYTYGEEQKYEDAIRYGKQAVALYTGNAYAFYVLGRVLLQSNDMVSAEASYKRAVQLDPSLREAYYDLACIKARQGRQEESLRWLESALHNGFNNRKMLWEDEDLSEIRSLPAFLALADRYFLNK